MSCPHGRKLNECGESLCRTSQAEIEIPRLVKEQAALVRERDALRSELEATKQTCARLVLELDAARAVVEARLAAAAPEMVRLLRSMLHGAPHDQCPSCQEPVFCHDVPHAPDCQLVATLSKAGALV